MSPCQWGRVVESIVCTSPPSLLPCFLAPLLASLFPRFLPSFLASCLPFVVLTLFLWIIVFVWRKLKIFPEPGPPSLCISLSLSFSLSLSVSLLLCFFACSFLGQFVCVFVCMWRERKREKEMRPSNHDSCAILLFSTLSLAGKKINNDG